MRRIAIWATLCLFLLGNALAKVQADQITTAVDINSPDMTMDISLRDADLNEVLTAMFNTTGGKYQLQVGNGVVGRIQRLQLIQTPFDKALDAVLGTEYSYQRNQIGNGNYLYKISGRSSTPTPDAGGGALPAFAPPTSAAPDASAASATPSAGSVTPSGASSASSPAPMLTITQTKKGGKTGDPASTETLVVNSIKVNNLDIAQLCSALGGTAVKLFVQTNGSNGSTGSTGSTGTNNNNTNNNNNNNNGYNNNGYNNNNNNNSNNNSNGYNNNNNNNSNNNGYNNNNSNNNNNNNNRNNTNTNNNNNNISTTLR